MCILPNTPFPYSPLVLGCSVEAQIRLSWPMASIVYVVPLLLLVLPFSEPISLSHPAFFNFGDSNSDTGGLAAGIAYPLGPPNGQTFFLKPSGRFCDGRLIIDFLMNSVDFPFLNPYLDSVGAPSFHTGCNFATGGSTILPSNAATVSPFSLGIQVSQFLRFKARVMEFLAKDKKLAKYLPQKENFAQALYMIDLGQNDIDGAFNSKSEDQVVAFIPSMLTELEAGMKELYEAGARMFWIHNTGPLGCLPRIIATYGKDPSKLDELGCVSSHNRAAKIFNSQLSDLYKQFQGQFVDANVTYVDIFAIKANLIANYSQFGFKQPNRACCGYGGAPLNYDDQIQCGQAKILNGSLVKASACNNTTEYVNWDGNHYTESANLHVSAQILTGNFSHDLSTQIPFLLKCN